jgi:hypothetical protein
MKKTNLKRREEKEENNKKKRSKSYTKKEKSKTLGHMVAPLHFDPKILPKGSAKLRWVRQEQGTSYYFHSLCGPVERKIPEFGRPKFDRFCLFLGIEL